MERYNKLMYWLCGTLLWLSQVTQAQDTKLWIGASSTNWSEAANWQPAGAPQALAAVVIKKPANGRLPLLDVNTTIQSLQIDLGASLTLNAHALTINGDLKVGTSGIAVDHLVLTQAEDELIVNGNATFAARTKLEAGRIVVRGNLTQETVNVAMMPSGTVFIFDGAAPQEVRFQRPGTNNQSFFNDVVVRNSSGVAFMSEVHFTGLLQLENGGKLLQQETAGVYYHGPLPRTQGGEYLVRKSYLASSLALQEDVALPNPQNDFTILARNVLTLNGHRLRIGGTFTVKAFVEQKHLLMTSPNEVLEIGGDAIFEGYSTLTAGTIFVGGNLTQRVGSGALQPAGTVFIFNGAQPQTVSFERPGSLPYRSFLQEVVITNPTAVNFASDVYVMGTLRLEAGRVAQPVSNSTYYTTALPVLVQGEYAISNTLVAGPIALTADLTLPRPENNLAVLPRSVLTLNGHKLEIGGNFKVGAFSAEKHLIMNNAADQLVINGDATFEGLSTLQAGTLVLRGNLTQSLSAAAVAPEGTAFVFDGKSLQLLSFERPGTGKLSFLRDVTINSGASVRALTNVFITGEIQNYGKFEVIDTRSLFLGEVAAVNHRSGVLLGSGTVSTPTKSLTNDGNVRPGASPGIMRIAGSYIQQPEGKLTIEIAGVTAGTQYSRLDVSGTAKLEGTLALDFTNGFKASVGDSFRVMNFRSAAGEFKQLLSAPHKNIELQVRYRATGVDVIAVQAANRAPLAKDDSITTRKNAALTLQVLRNDFDENEDVLRVTALDLTHTLGTAQIVNDSTIAYAPPPNFVGVDVLGYTISDGRGGMCSANVLVHVESYNQAPSAFALVLPQNGAVLNPVAPLLFRWQAAQDANGDALVYRLRLRSANLDTTLENITGTEVRLHGKEVLRGAATYTWFVSASDAEFSTASVDTFTFTTATVSGVATPLGEVPAAFALAQNYPNPFNPSTSISFDLPTSSEVTLTIYNMSGQVVRQLTSGKFTAGRHSLTWDATNTAGERVSSGTYLYVIKAGEFTAQRKLMLMK